MKEELITFETAKLAKEKGFDWEVNSFYRGADHELILDMAYLPVERRQNSKFVDSTSIAAPTHALLQKWLREVHNIDIDILKTRKHLSALEVIHSYCSYVGLREESTADEKTYELALEKGLIEALKLIE